MPRPIQAIIHPHALTHNLNIARQHMPDSHVFTVVKANAYGHGIERVYDVFKSADGFALLDLAEAQRIRALGWTGRILLLEGIFAFPDLYVCAEHHLSFSLHSHHQVEWLKQFDALEHHDVRFDVYLKMNTGMNRLGFLPEDYRNIWQELIQLQFVSSITHMMHFSDADGERFSERGIDYQIKVFEQSIEGLPGERSLCNSAAILRHSSTIQSDVIRSGIMLYGSSPDYPTHNIQDWGLKPTMSLRSEIIAIQTIKEGQSVGYGSQFIAPEEMRIGIVACGYADGYQRISPTGTPVLVDSIRTQTLGRVSMDMLAVDLSTVSSARIGSEVVLWGYSSQGVILAIDDVAASSGTLGYELMCGVTTRVPFSIELKQFK